MGDGWAIVAAATEAATGWLVPEWLQILTPWLIAVTGIVAGVFTARLNKGGARENAIIDQVQEERASAVAQLHSEREEMRAEREEMRAEREELRGEREEMRRLRDEMRDERIEAQTLLAATVARLAETEKREKSLLKYARRLFHHIMIGSPPPPPTLPLDMLEWYGAFDPTTPE